MSTMIIKDSDLIVKLTGDNRYRIILLHLNKDKREAEYEEDYTNFELTRKLDYREVIKLLFE